MGAGSRLARLQARLVILLLVGYTGYYFCRSNFSVCKPLILSELEEGGYSEEGAKLLLGWIVSLGTLSYAAGKFLSGGLADFVGGRRNYLFGMIASVCCTVAFALGGAAPVFTTAWFLNRLVQSMGWSGMMKVCSRWFPHGVYGTVIGVISLSYLFGDALGRWWMSALIGAGMGWRGVYFTMAGALLAIFAVSAAFVRESPRDFGEEEPLTNPENLYGEAGEESRPPGLRELLAPLASRPSFWIICVLSFVFTLIRETFNTWTPTYLAKGVGLSEASAAANSAWFPLLGGVSVLLAGFASDALGRRGRAVIILAGMALTCAALFALGALRPDGAGWLAVGLVGAIGFIMIGPYSYLAGAMALDLGGKRGGATACGIIDGVGYLGGVLSGAAFAELSNRMGWQGGFRALAALAGCAILFAAAYLFTQRDGVRPRRGARARAES